MKKLPLFILVISVFVICGCSQSEGTNLSGDISEETSTYIENKGSDTMVNLALAWAELYQELYPEIRISVTGGGSGTGIASLTNGTVDLANASRQIKAEEKELAIENGFEPYEYIVAKDAIAVIVNTSNSVDRLTLQQISQIYKGEITNWLEVGGDDHPIVCLSRETNSGTHVYFLETVIRLGNKDDKDIFSADTLLLPSSEGIISEVRDNPNAIGYDGLGYVTDEVKMVSIAKDNNSPYIVPSADTVVAGIYPIARDLYIYSKGKPQGTILEYLNWISSPVAQEIVSELGFVPIQANE